MKKLSIKGLKAFTLVELIIVITILTILGTVSFIAFQDYFADARDANRVTTMKNIENAMNTYKMKVKRYPLPEDITGTGSIGGVELTYVGYIKDEIANLIEMKTTPIDPSTKSYYVYGVSSNKKYYQLAATIESLQANNIIATTYADEGYKAKVSGNYKGLLRYNDKIYNIPSLIFTGSGNLLSNETYFVVDKGENIPYGLENETPQNTQTGGQILALLGSTAKSVTGITFPAMTSWNTQSGTLSQALGYKIDIIGQTLYGDNYYTPQTPVRAGCSFSGNTIAHNASVTAYQTSTVPYGSGCVSQQRTCSDGVLNGTYTFGSCSPLPPNNCTSTTYSGITITALTHAQSQNFTKPITYGTGLYGSGTYGTGDLTATCTNGVLSYGSINTTCTTNYVPSGTWNCILDTCSGTMPANAQINGTQGSGSWIHSTTSGVCKFVCQAGYYWNGTTSCVAASAGYYVTSTGQTTQTSCTTGQYQDVTAQTTYKSCSNKPANSAYTGSTALTTNTCPWSCNGGFHTEDSVTCISNTKTITIPNGSCTQTWGGSSRGACTTGTCTNGLTWSVVNGCNVITDAILFANTNSGVIKYSSDGGNTFSTLASYPDYAHFYGYSVSQGNLYINPYMGTGGVYKIGVNGSFNILFDPYSFHGNVGFESTGVLLGINTGINIYKTINNGTTWANISDSSWTGSFFRASLFTDNTSKVITSWCNTNVTPRVRYYYYSNDYGTTWTNISSNFFTTGNNEFYGYGEYINGAFYMYAPTGTGSMGLYKSLSGTTWTSLGIPNVPEVFKTSPYGGGSHKTRIIYYNGKYYGYSANKVYQSTDMLTWTVSKASPSVSEIILGLTKTSTGFIVATHNSTTKEVSLYDLDFSFTSYTNKRVIISGITNSRDIELTLDNFASYK